MHPRMANEQKTSDLNHECCNLFKDHQSGLESVMGNLVSVLKEYNSIVWSGISRSSTESLDSMRASSQLGYRDLPLTAYLRDDFRP